MAEDGRLKAFAATGQPGEVNGRAKLTESDVRQIRALRASGETITALAERFQVTRRTIRLAVTGETWGHIA